MSQLATFDETRPHPVGSAEPRVFTKPLRPLTPETSYGYALLDLWQRVIPEKPMAWHRFLATHLGELREDGKPRFKTAVVIAGRQNAKTSFGAAHAMHTMDTPNHRVLGISAARTSARDAWRQTVAYAEDTADFYPARRSNGSEELEGLNGSTYKLKAATARATRGQSSHLCLIDELQSQTWESWSAASKTTNATGGLKLCFATGPFATSDVLLHLRSVALSGADPSIGWFEWSADPKHCGSLQCVVCLAAANPALGHTIELETLISDSHTDPAGLFRREVLCQSVLADDSLIQADAWADCADAVGSLQSVRGRVHVGVDASPSGHVSVAVAALLPDGRVRVEMAAAYTTTNDARTALSGKLRAIKARSVTVAPGPAPATLGVALGTHTIATTAALGDAAGGFVDLVASRQLLHSDDPLLSAHALSVAKKPMNNGGFTFERASGNCDAVVAASLAVRACRTATKRPLRIVTAKS